MSQPDDFGGGGGAAASGTPASGCGWNCGPSTAHSGPQTVTAGELAGQAIGPGT